VDEEIHFVTSRANNGGDPGRQNNANKLRALPFGTDICPSESIRHGKLLIRRILWRTSPENLARFDA